MLKMRELKYFELTDTLNENKQTRLEFFGPQMKTFLIQSGYSPIMDNLKRDRSVSLDQTTLDYLTH